MNAVTAVLLSNIPCPLATRAVLITCVHLVTSSCLKAVFSVSEETMGSRWPRGCAVSGLLVAVISAVLAATFPLAYQSIVNYVGCTRSMN